MREEHIESTKVQLNQDREHLLIVKRSRCVQVVLMKATRLKISNKIITKVLH